MGSTERCGEGWIVTVTEDIDQDVGMTEEGG